VARGDHRLEDVDNELHRRSMVGRSGANIPQLATEHKMQSLIRILNLLINGDEAHPNRSM